MLLYPHRIQTLREIEVFAEILDHRYGDKE